MFKNNKENKNVDITHDEFKQLCRSCLNGNALIDLFETKHNEVLFSDIFKMLSLQNLDSMDDLPKKICDICAKLLKDFYSFKERIQDSQLALKDILDTINNKVKIEVTTVLSEKISDSEDRLSDSSDKKSTTLNNELSSDIICNFCNLKFENNSDYRTHRKKEAELRRKKKHCMVCNKLISTYKLKDHLNSHTKATPYKCGICGQRFRFSSSLSRHRFKHNDKKPHECHICGKGFIQAPTLTDHLRTHLGEKSFICNVCGKTFITKHALGNHIYMHKSQNVTENDLNNLTCKTCNSSFTSPQLLKQHSKIHFEKTFLCNNCGKKFSTQGLLNSHIKNHSDDKPHICTICNKGFSQKSSLLKHSYTHSGIKSINCFICNKKFSQKGHLTYHMRKHSGERPYNCSYCEKSFSHSGSYKIHMRIHTGERPYVCSICQKGFYDSSSLKKHEKIHKSTDNNC